MVSTFLASVAPGKNLAEVDLYQAAILSSMHPLYWGLRTKRKRSQMCKFFEILRTFVLNYGRNCKICAEVIRKMLNRVTEVVALQQKDSINGLKLGFSGGGFRATFYCVGAYRQLVSLGIHENVTHISSVSGGSIAAGAIMAALSFGGFTDVNDFDLRVTKPLIALAQGNLRAEVMKRSTHLVYLLPVAVYVSGAIAAKLFEIIRTRTSDKFPEVLNERIFHGMLMKDLPSSPEWSCNTTCLNTLKRFRIKQSDMYGNQIGKSTQMDDITVAFAVAASAAYPLGFAPLRLYTVNRQFLHEYEKEKTIPLPSIIYLTDGPPGAEFCRRSRRRRRGNRYRECESMYRQALAELREAGYVFDSDGETLTYQLTGNNAIPKEWVMARLNILRDHKAEVIALVVAMSRDRAPQIAVDIETTGLDPRQDDIRLISAATAEGSSVTENPGDLGSALADKGIRKVFHNATFDVGFLETKGFSVNNYSDTMVMAQVLSNNRGDHSLAALAQKYLGITLDKGLQDAGKWRGEITEAHRRYSRTDSEVTLKLAERLQDLIAKRRLEPVLAREIAALPAIDRLHRDGMPFAAADWRDALAKWVAERDALADAIRLDLGSAVNLVSPKQLITCLRNRGIAVASTTDESLAKIEHEDPVIASIRKWRELQKITTSFGTELVAKTAPDGRIYPNWRLIGTTTGRMSCSGPNIQQAPRILRPYFRTPSGRVFVIADYSQIELRVVAQLSGDPVMLKAFHDDEDLHVKTVRMILKKEDISKAERQVAKTANFGLIYGMSAFGLKSRVKTQYGLDITEQEAERFRQGFFALYKGVRRWQDRQLKRPKIRTVGGRASCPADSVAAVYMGFKAEVMRLTSL